MKKVVLYSSNSKRRSPSSNCIVFPKWAQLWDRLADKHPDCEITLVVQLNGRYFLDIHNGEVTHMPEKINVKILDMDDKLDAFVTAIEDIHPDVAIAMPGPVSGIDWNGIRDAGIAEELERRGIKTICYPLKTAMDCFDKWRTHVFLETHGFNVAKAVFCHHEMFFAGQGDNQSTGNVYQEYVLEQVKNLPFPIILKGTTGSSSTGITIAHSYEEAESYLLSEKNGEDLIIEELLKGQEYGTEIHGCKGHFNVLPPFMKFTTDNEEVIDPLGLTTVKFGPMKGEAYHTDELISELTRMAELMELNGNNNLDLMLVGDKWYIIEINARWSGLTTLTTSAEGRTPYDIYMDQYTGSDVDYTDLNNIGYSCNFKMSQMSDEQLEELSKKEHVDSVVQYEVIRSADNKFVFSDVVIGGFNNYSEMSECLGQLQKQYPEAISADVVTSVGNKLKSM